MSFLASLPPYGDERDAFIERAIVAGKLDAPTWIPLSGGVLVSSDYLTIEGEHVPMSLPVALLAVRSLGAALPTRTEVDEIAKRPGAVPIPMPTLPRAGMLTAAAFVRAEELTRERMAASEAPPGSLFYGARKELVAGAPAGRVAIYGGLREGGGYWQHVVNDWSHEAAYADYSHGVRAVRRPAPVRRPVLEVALSYLGQGETPARSNAGPFVARCLAGAVRGGRKVGLRSGNWCAAFVGLCDSEAGVSRTWRCAVHELVTDARAAGTWRDIAEGYEPAPGDLVVYRRDGQDPRRGGLGHVGYVAGSEGGVLLSVEGNKGDRVADVRTLLPEPAIVGWVVTRG